MSCDAKDGQIPESTSTPADPPQAGQSAALGKGHDLPAESGIEYELHYSPATRESLLWCSKYFPFEILENWLKAHPDAILVESPAK